MRTEESSYLKGACGGWGDEVEESSCLKGERGEEARELVGQVSSLGRLGGGERRELA